MERISDDVLENEQVSEEMLKEGLELPGININIEGNVKNMYITVNIFNETEEDE